MPSAPPPEDLVERIDAIRDRRVQLGLTLRTLAERAGLSVDTVRRVLGGESQPRARSLAALEIAIAAVEDEVAGRPDPTRGDPWRTDLWDRITRDAAVLDDLGLAELAATAARLRAGQAASA